MVQALRRPDSGASTMTFLLRGLKADAHYEVENADGGKETRAGRDLMEHGLAVTLPERSSAAVITYRKVAE